MRKLFKFFETKRMTAEVIRFITHLSFFCRHRTVLVVYRVVQKILLIEKIIKTIQEAETKKHFNTNFLKNTQNPMRDLISNWPPFALIMSLKRSFTKADENCTPFLSDLVQNLWTTAFSESKLGREQVETPVSKIDLIAIACPKSIRTEPCTTSGSYTIWELDYRPV